MNTEWLYPIALIAIIAILWLMLPPEGAGPDTEREEPAPDLRDLLRKAAAERWLVGNEVPMTPTDFLLEDATDAGLLRARPEGSTASIVRFEITDAGRAFIGLPPKPTLGQKLRRLLARG